ncbi:MAG: hypothetical protein R3199_05985 [Gemmatimonadota bacterium]|nr:hypothetical protein [Gemmatimonadota bacterium]
MRGGRLLPLLAAASLAVAGCSEEDRKAWVSILPERDGEEDEEAAGPGFAIAADSTAVLLGGDTLFTLRALPPRGPAGRSLKPARISRVVPSPDTTAVAFTTIGANESVGVWSRGRGAATIAAVFAGGRADAIGWSADGRWLSFQGRSVEGPTRVGLLDTRTGRTVRHPVLDYLADARRDVRLQEWVRPGRLRLLVATGAGEAAGLLYLWSPSRGNLAVEPHLDAILDRLPGGASLGGTGVFSVDLLGDAAPETVALYRAASGAPAALLMRGGATELEASTTEPLVEPPPPVGKPGRAALRRIVTLGARPALLLSLSGPEEGGVAGLFRAGAGGRLFPIGVRDGEGTRAAIFPVGQRPEGEALLELVDLDRDGEAEIVSATAGTDGDPGRRAGWRIEVFREEAGDLTPAPELEGLAREALGEATGEDGVSAP